MGNLLFWKMLIVLQRLAISGRTAVVETSVFVGGVTPTLKRGVSRLASA
jgi:hypothetical protein